MSNPYNFNINDLMVVVYASTRTEAEKKFSKAINKYNAEVRADAIDECIDELDYCETVSECRGVLRELKERIDVQSFVCEKKY